jgi:hypothetical protein
VWTSAWLHGLTAPDDVLDALSAWGEAHHVHTSDQATADLLDLPGPGSFGASPAMLLAVMRKAGARFTRLALPAAGDLRGLPADDELRTAALDAGEVVLAAGASGAELAMVPETLPEGLVRWRVFRTEPAPAVPPIGLGEAEQGLRAAVRAAAATLTGLDVARHRPEVREEIAAALRGRARPVWPAGTPQRVLRVLEHADEVAAILAAAIRDDPGGALSSSAARARAAALRPLEHGVRDARLAAVAEAVRALTDDHADSR